MHLAHPLGNNWGNRRVKNDLRDAEDLADLFRLGRLAEAWIAPPEVRELRELVRYRSNTAALSGAYRHACQPRRETCFEAGPWPVPPVPVKSAVHFRRPPIESDIAESMAPAAYHRHTPTRAFASG